MIRYAGSVSGDPARAIADQAAAYCLRPNLSLKASVGAVSPVQHSLF